ncbi:MAG: prepilin-type N-terminal cleavage/methylation domain-containing protein [Chitinivibrionales bacterium]|nr:prepilin-type N-terminal cleavage/methylation domain-containing protein [Chitinivibrionales bacterium]
MRAQRDAGFVLALVVGLLGVASGKRARKNRMGEEPVSMAANQSPVRQGVNVNEQRGLTLIEVVVAIAILGFSLPAIMRLVASADTMRGRANQVTAAAQLARNEVERLRTTARRSESLNDTSYTHARDGLELRLERRIVGDDFNPFEEELATREIQIDVFVDEQRLTSHRLLQGYDF